MTVAAFQRALIALGYDLGAADANLFVNAAWIGDALTPAQEAGLSQLILEHCAEARAWT